MTRAFRFFHPEIGLLPDLPLPDPALGSNDRISALPTPFTEENWPKAGLFLGILG